MFDTLDSDSNGYLTLDEFSSGFSRFYCPLQTSTSLLQSTRFVLSSKLPPFFFLGAFLFGRRISVEDGMWEKNPSKSQPEVLYQSQWEEDVPKADEDEDKDEEEKHFCMLMDNLGANSVFEK